MYVTDPEGWAHSHCYARAHPPLLAQSIEDVVSGMSETALARDVLTSHIYLAMSFEQRLQMVREFNTLLSQRYRERCAELETAATNG